MKKKNGFLVLVVVCVALLAIVLVKNVNNEAYDIDYTELSREQIMRKMPEAVVTEADLAVEEKLLTIPSIQESAKISYSVAVPVNVAEELIGDLLPQDAEIIDLSGGGDYMFLTYRQGEVQTTIQFRLDGRAEPYKCTKVSSRTWYEAMPDGTFRKNTMKRDWLYFLKG